MERLGVNIKIRFDIEWRSVEISDLVAATAQNRLMRWVVVTLQMFSKADRALSQQHYSALPCFSSSL
jgi:hypothetical protein